MFLTIDAPPQLAHSQPTGEKIRRHILFDEALWNRAKEWADREGVSVGVIVNRALRAYLER